MEITTAAIDDALTIGYRLYTWAYPHGNGDLLRSVCFPPVIPGNPFPVTPGRQFMLSQLWNTASANQDHFFPLAFNTVVRTLLHGIHFRPTPQTPDPYAFSPPPLVHTFPLPESRAYCGILLAPASSQPLPRGSKPLVLGNLLRATLETGHKRTRICGVSP